MSVMGLHTYYLQIVDFKNTNWEAVKRAILAKPFEMFFHAYSYSVKLQWHETNVMSNTLRVLTYNHEDIVRFVTDQHLENIKERVGDFRHILLKDVTISTNETFGPFGN